MKKTIGGWIRENFPQTSSVTGLFISGIGVLAVNTLLLEKLLVSNIPLDIFIYLGLILIALFFLILVFELLSKMMPILKNVINFLMKIINFLRSVYVWIIKFLIRKAVVSIIEERDNISNESLTFQNNPPNVDDNYWNRTVDFTKIIGIEMIVKPSKETKYWRLGFKFSQNDVFIDVRHGKDYPLFHLTKDSTDNKLKITYYDKDGAGANQEILSSYTDDIIKLLVRVSGISDDLEIVVKDKSNKELYLKKLEFTHHKFAQIFAWGDSRNYELDATIRIQERG